MKIFYLINSRMPTEKAEGVEAMKLCEAFAKARGYTRSDDNTADTRGNYISGNQRSNQRESASIEVEMVAPRRLNKIKEDPFAFYGVERNFKIVKLPVIDLIPFLSSKIIFWIEAISFSVSCLIYLLIYSKKEDIIFSHDQISLFLISFLRKNAFYDIHDFPRGGFGLYGCLFKNLAGIITTNKWKREQLIKKFKLNENKILSWPNGVDLEKFDLKISKEEARKKLDLPQDKILVGYVGMLKTMGMGKGIETAIGALKFLLENVMLVLVGGSEEDVDEYEKAAERAGLVEKVNFVGWVKHELIPYYLKAFDVLIAPFPRNDHYEFYMCPMKILEYMASKRPIVASDLNSIRELISEKESVLIQPESEEALAAGIKQIIENQQFADEISSSAFNKAQNFTWQNRAQAIINFMESFVA